MPGRNHTCVATETSVLNVTLYDTIVPFLPEPTIEMGGNSFQGVNVLPHSYLYEANLQFLLLTTEISVTGPSWGES